MGSSDSKEWGDATCPETNWQPLRGLENLMKPRVKYFADHFRKLLDTHQPPPIDLSDCDDLGVLGKGGFGVVKRMFHEPSGKLLAVKFQSKRRIVKSNGVRQVLFERDVLHAMNFDFIIKLLYKGSTPRHVLLAFDYMPCGSLQDVLRDYKALIDEAAARFFIAQIVLMVEYLSLIHVTHGDLKPANILVDGSGYLKLTDFGSAEVLYWDKSYIMRGTLPYMAPEMLLQWGYFQTIDIWSFGCIAYRTLYMVHPIPSATTRREIISCIENNRINFDLPREGLSDRARDFVRAVLEMYPGDRIGCRSFGVKEIRQDPFFENIGWIQLYQQQIQCPIEISARFAIADPGETNSAELAYRGELSMF